MRVFNSGLLVRRYRYVLQSLCQVAFAKQARRNENLFTHPSWLHGCICVMERSVLHNLCRFLALEDSRYIHQALGRAF